MGRFTIDVNNVLQPYKRPGRQAIPRRRWQLSTHQTASSHLITTNHVIHVQEVKELLPWRHLQDLASLSGSIQYGEESQASVTNAIRVRELQRHGPQTTYFIVELKDILESLLGRSVQRDRTILSALVVLHCGARVHNGRHASHSHGLKKLYAKQDVALHERIHVIDGVFSDDQ
jgi:hypothetical protein